MDGWPRIIDDCYQGDPFMKLIEAGGKRYLLSEAALIESEEATYRAFEMSMRLKLADDMRRMGLPW
jgi:hypothetical protein